MSRDRRKRLGSSTAAVTASAVSCPTPGMLINRRHASDALTIRLMSASIATMAASTAARAPIRPPHGGGQSRDAVTRLQRLLDEGGTECTWQSDTEHDGEAADLVLESDPMPDQLLASDDQRPDRMCRQGFHVNGLEESGSCQMRQATRVVAVGLVGR